MRGLVGYLGLLSVGLGTACGEDPGGPGNSGVGGSVGGKSGESGTAGAGESGRRPVSSGGASGTASGGTAGEAQAAGEGGEAASTRGDAGEGGAAHGGEAHGGEAHGAGEGGTAPTGDHGGAAGEAGGGTDPGPRTVQSCALPEDLSRWAAGRTLYVDDDAECEGLTPCYSVVDAAVRAAEDGDTVMLLPGRHWGASILQDEDFANLRITSRDGPTVTSIEEYCLVINGDEHVPGEIWIDHLTIQNCGPASSSVEDGWGIYVNNWGLVDVRIQDNVFLPGQEHGAVTFSTSTTETTYRAVVARNRFFDHRQDTRALTMDLPGDAESNHCVRVENNVFAGNDSAVQVGYYDEGVVPGQVEIVNNTIAGNIAGLSVANRGILVANNVIFGNDSDVFANAELGDAAFLNNLIGSGQFSGLAGNFAADPLFVDADNRNFEPGIGSPAMGQGSPGPAPLVDIDGRPRGAVVDLGAFERREQANERHAGLECGDGEIQRGPITTATGDYVGFESCDDSNTRAGDGCSAHCQNEPELAPPGLISFEPPTLCVVRLDGTLSCWGRLEARVPTGAFDQVAVSSYHGCALASDGSATCWEEYGTSFVPELEFSQLASDGSRVCGLHAEGITCWDRDAVTATYPGSFTEIFVEGRVCARTTAGMPTCWDPTPAFAQDPFLQLLPDLGGGCALRTDGTLKCVEETSAFADYDEAHAVFLRADAADNTIVALRPDGRTVQWRSGTMTFPAPDQRFIDVRAILNAGCGLKADRKVYCWGTTAYPQE